MKYLAVSVVLVCCMLCPAAFAAEEKPAPIVILDTASYWRCHAALRPPVYGTDQDAKPDPKTVPQYRKTDPKTGRGARAPVMPPDQPRTPLPPEDWMKADFDDAGWWRDPGPFFAGPRKRVGSLMLMAAHSSRYGCNQPEPLALLCARGKFTVADPAAVTSLTLSAEFRGGIRIYINGEELVRKHLPGGEIGFETLAEGYPLEVYGQPGGWGYDRGADKGPAMEACERRIRKIENLEIPPDKLRRGTNVVALEIHRAPIHPESLKMRGGSIWNHAGLNSITLAGTGAGLVPNVTRPAGVQVWNANTIESVFDTDYGDPHEPLRPLSIAAARNGTFSGQVVVGSDKPMKNMKVAIDGCSGITVRVQYARSAGAGESPGKTTSGRSHRFVLLDENPRAEIPVKKSRKPTAGPGAVQPVWAIADISPDVPAKTYEGTLTISLDGADPVKVPVRVQVHDFALPAPRDFTTWADFIQSPETPALYYKVPLWSDEHFRLIRKSFDLLATVGNKTLYVPLICRSNIGNTESMVRRVKKDDGTYDADFAVMERYLDTALAAGLVPKVVSFRVWDYHIGADPKANWGVGGRAKDRTPRNVPVTVLDPVTGKAAELAGPRYDEPAAEAFWKPVAEGITERMKKRGLGDAMMLGIVADSIPRQEIVEFWKKLLPDTPWVCMAHGGGADIFGVPFKYRTTVFQTVWAVDPEAERRYGWKREKQIAHFPRLSSNLPLTYNRMVWEWNIQGNQRGVGRLAADFFIIPQEKRRTLNLARRFAESSWTNLNLRESWLAPGPDGAVNTICFQMAREGIQECEARIHIERALIDPERRKALGDERAAVLQSVLDERTRANLYSIEINNYKLEPFLRNGALGFDWFSSGAAFPERSRALYAAAASVR